MQEPPTCSCSSCARMCVNPGILAPWEAELHDPMKLAVYNTYGFDTLRPANPGYEGKENFKACGGCVFFDKGLCSMHDVMRDGIPLKPMECRLAPCAQVDMHTNVHYSVAHLWDTVDGRKVVADWRESILRKKCTNTERDAGLKLAL